MNLAYIKERDTLYLERSPENPTHAREPREGIVINLAGDGRVVGIEIERVGDFPGEVRALAGAAH